MIRVRVNTLPHGKPPSYSKVKHHYNLLLLLLLRRFSTALKAAIYDYCSAFNTMAKSTDKNGNPYNYIVVLDAGSKGTRAFLYRSEKAASMKSQESTENEKGSNKRGKKEINRIKNDKDHDSDSENDDADDADSDSKSWKESSKHKISPSTPKITLIKHKKIKPGLTSFDASPHQISQYLTHLLDPILHKIPADQIARTPIFLHATGGMRLMKPEDQDAILTEVCKNVKQKYAFFVPECKSHFQVISGEVEGLYGWIGLNYKFGKLDLKESHDDTLGMLDMGGVSSQIAFQPSDPIKNEDALFHVNLDYLNAGRNVKLEDKRGFKVFAQSLLSGMDQSHVHYEKALVSQSKVEDPCLPKDYIKYIPTGSKDSKQEVKGTGSFDTCLTALDGVLQEVSKDKYCDPSDVHSTASCLLSDEISNMRFNAGKFIGINEFYSKLKKYGNYEEFYKQSKELCGMSITDLQNTEEYKDVEREKLAEMCFRSSWLISVLHDGVGFPRYGIDDDIEAEDSKQADSISNLSILKDYSWTLGRAVLYTYYETAYDLLPKNSIRGIKEGVGSGNQSMPFIGYYEPFSKRFVYGGEREGLPMRPAYAVSASSEDSSKDSKHEDDDDNKGKNGHNSDDDDDDDDDDADWDEVLEDHRLWGSLTMLMILLIVVYLMLGKTKRQSIVYSVKRTLNSIPFFRSVGAGLGGVAAGVMYNRVGDEPTVVADGDDLELGDLSDFEIDTEENDDRALNLEENARASKDHDSFEIE